MQNFNPFEKTFPTFPNAAWQHRYDATRAALDAGGVSGRDGWLGDLHMRRLDDWVLRGESRCELARDVLEQLVALVATRAVVYEDDRGFHVK